MYTHVRTNSQCRLPRRQRPRIPRLKIPGTNQTDGLPVISNAKTPETAHRAFLAPIKKNKSGFHHEIKRKRPTPKRPSRFRPSPHLVSTQPATRRNKKDKRMYTYYYKCKHKRTLVNTYLHLHTAVRLRLTTSTRPTPPQAPAQHLRPFPKPTKIPYRRGRVGGSTC